MKEEKVIKSTLAKEQTVKAMDKLKRERVDVSMNPKKYLLEYSRGELVKLEKVDREGMTPEEITLLNSGIKAYKESIVGYEKAKLEGVMVPLKYADLQVIKGFVTEMVKHANLYNWDDDITMRAMIREEHTLTVYFSLRKKDNLAVRYYAVPEDVAKETDTTVDELYNIYSENFILTGQERGNS